MQEKFRKPLVLLTAAAVGSFALSGCKSSANTIGGYSAADRFNYDYGGGNPDGFLNPHAASDCLSGTPYDVDNSRAPSGSVTTEDGNIIVKPANDGPSLTLEKVSSHEPLQPVNDATRAVLAAYDCPLVYK